MPANEHLATFQRAIASWNGGDLQPLDNYDPNVICHGFDPRLPPGKVGATRTSIRVYGQRFPTPTHCG